MIMFNFIIIFIENKCYNKDNTNDYPQIFNNSRKNITKWKQFY